MATLLFTALGTLIGGPLAGALGALAGQQVDNATFGGAVQGPRLLDLTVTTSSYGVAIPRHFGKMRVAGSIIWATDLVEHSHTQGGKGSPSVTTYTYTSSFAVALSSRPLASVGRIWADGSLLRGAAGDLKVGGTLRFYPGDYSQPQDTLIASAEGTTGCPAFRGLSYLVFEDLDLTNFGNRIPAITFEVFADTGALSLEQLFDGMVQPVQANVPLTGVAGYSCEGSYKDTLTKFQPVFPMNCNADGSTLTIGPELAQPAPIMLGETAVSGAQGDMGGKSGFTRKRAPAPLDPPMVLRYYDVNRDYQPGSQRATGQATPGQPRTIELPAVLDANDAFVRISQTSRNAAWALETLQWRCAELDPSVVPGAIVNLPNVAGTWRVTEWEWTDKGVELWLERLPPGNLGVSAITATGTANTAADVPVTATTIVAYELPWDGLSSNDSAPVYVSASSVGAGWAGASLFADASSGGLMPVGNTKRTRNLIGQAVGVLPPAVPTMFDRSSALQVQLLSQDMALSSATADQLLNGANRALVGSEIIQFASAASLGSGLWRLTGLLRGRGATETAVGNHVANETFVLLDGTATVLDGATIGSDPSVSIAALGLGDAVPVDSHIVNRGITLAPLAPVHGMAIPDGSGGLILQWTRRARGAWIWSDLVDAPLVEESETYQVGYGPPSAPLGIWSCTSPSFNVSVSALAGLRSSLPHGAFFVRQIGTYAASPACAISE